jgi:iron complex outermembrane receptor protein
MQVSASTFRNRLNAMISQRIDSSDNNRLVNENVGAIESKGIELTNSPREMVKLELRVPLDARNMTAGIDAQYESGRRTIAGTTAPGQVVTNLSFLAPLAFHRFDLSATAYNLFGVKYGIPSSDEFLQNVIPQDGRSFRVQTTLHY